MRRKDAELRSRKSGRAQGAHERIRSVVRLIPEGRVVTYGQVAEIAGGVTPRMVGYAMASLRPSSGVPWHRVVNASGEISLPSGAGAEEQRAMLESEGIVFDEKGRIDLEKFRWSGPGASSS